MLRRTERWRVRTNTFKIPHSTSCVRIASFSHYQSRRIEISRELAGVDSFARSPPEAQTWSRPALLEAQLSMRTQTRARFRSVEVCFSLVLQVIWMYRQFSDRWRCCPRISIWVWRTGTPFYSWLWNFQWARFEVDVIPLKESWEKGLMVNSSESSWMISCLKGSRVVSWWSWLWKWLCDLLSWWTWLWWGWTWPLLPSVVAASRRHFWSTGHFVHHSPS